MNYWMHKVVSTTLVIAIPHCLAMTLPAPRYNNIYGPVCGSNFETYATLLNFLEAQKIKESLVIIHPGKCKRTCTLYYPVCGNDSKNYHNECQFNYAKGKNFSLSIKHFGLCTPDGTIPDMQKLSRETYTEEIKKDVEDYFFEWDFRKKKCFLSDS